MNQLWLSVVMPTYNGVAHLGDALESIAGQNLHAVEIIAVDDGSTDATLELLHDFASRLPLRIVQAPHSGNWVANTNLGLRESSGEYACLLHQDDQWLAGRLQAMRDAVQRTPSAGLVIHSVCFMDDAGRDVGAWSLPFASSRTDLQPDEVLEALLVQNFISVPGALFRRELALQAGGLDEALWYTADWDLWLKLAAASECIVQYAAPLARFRVHTSSQTLQRSAVGDGFREQLERVLERHLPDWVVRHPGHRDVLSAARLSMEVNVALAAAAHGQRAGWASLAWRFLKLGPLGWRRYLRDSRIVERVRARRRAGL